LGLQDIKNLFADYLLQIRSGTLSHKRSFVARQIRTVLLALRGFDEDKCALRASALTFYSLLAIVPAAALAFGIAKGFGMQKMLERELLEKMRGQEEVISRVIEFANSALEQTKGGLIAGVGTIILIWLIIKLLGNIEKSFNDIWGITHQRPLGRKLSDYLSFLFVAPILIILSSSITVFITTQITLITEKIDFLGSVSPLILFLIKLFPYVFIWLLFMFVYIFMPNTKVSFRSGLLGGVVAGTIYEIVQWVYISFQVGAARYGAIYGSFAALPLFMIWLQVSWLIVLFGAEIAFAHQNVDTYELEPESLGASPAFRRLLALAIAHVCIKNFSKGDRPWTARDISNNLGIPVRLTNQILNDLVQSGVLTETIGTDERDPLYQPGRDINLLDISFVIKALDELGNKDIPLERTEKIEKISECLEGFKAMIDRSEENLLLKDI
jgi:membrane protein